MEKSPVGRINVLGVPVDCVNPENLEVILEALADQDKNQRIIFIDMATILRARKKAEWMSFISDAALVLPLTKTVTSTIRFLYAKDAYPYIPLDLILQLMTILERKRASVYLLGSRPHILQQADLNLRGTYPGLRFVGRHAGYFNKKNQNTILEAIRKTSPVLLITSRGLKGNELWMYRHEQNLNANIAIYSQDCFDIFANKKSRPSTEQVTSHNPFLTFLVKPWTFFNLFPYLYFQILLVIQRIRIRKKR